MRPYHTLVIEVIDAKIKIPLRHRNTNSPVPVE